jgi:hypothetical protein
MILTVRTRVVALYVDRTSRQWIARDSNGDLWSLPPTENPWDGRQAFSPAEEAELEPVPGQYKAMLGLPT